MSYEQLWKEAVKDKQTVNVSPVWFAFEKEGSYVLGKLKGTSEVPSALGQGVYNQYLMETDDGLVKFALGAASDRELATVLKVGGVYRIEYLGQLKIKGGRRVNQFRVMAPEETDDVSSPDEDQPF